MLGLGLAGCHRLLGLQPSSDPRADRSGLEAGRELGQRDQGRDRDAGPSDVRRDRPVDDRPVDLRADRPRDLAPDQPPLIQPPRPVAPLSGSVSHGESLLFTWALPPGTDAARLELTWSGGSYTTDLSPGVLSYTIKKSALAAGRTLTWRLRGLRQGQTGTKSSPTWRLWLGKGSVPGSTAAWGVVPDLDGDGLADLVVGAPGANEVRVYRGSPSSVPTVPDFTLVSGAGFGSSLAAVDLDGDGVLELIVGAPSAPATAATGRVAIYPASALTSLKWLDGTQPAGSFGAAVAGIGDFDGDGYGDLVVGEPGHAGSATQVGRVLLYRGGPGAPVHAASLTSAATTKLGVRVAAAGDVNGDHLADFLAADEAEHVYLCPGTATIAATLSCAPLVGYSGNGYGQAIAGVGDLDGTGYADAIVSAPAGNSGAGVLLVYHGKPGGFGNPMSVGFGGTTVSAGRAVAGAGDVNADGLDEFLVGAVSAYSVYRWTGASFTELAGNVIPSFPSFGAAVAGLGDVNGDGFGDAAVGVPGAARVDWEHGSGSNPTSPGSIFGTAGSSFGAVLLSVY